MKRGKGKHIPLPGIVDGEKWKIEDGGSGVCVSRAEKHMIVPLDSAETSREARQHELAHVRYSPATVPEVDGAFPMVVQAVEDARLTYLLKKNHKMSQDARTKEALYPILDRFAKEAEEDDKEVDPVGYALACVAATGTSLKFLRKVRSAKSQWSPLLERCVKIAKGHLSRRHNSFKDTEQVAQNISQLLAPLMQEGPGPPVSGEEEKEYYDGDKPDVGTISDQWGRMKEREADLTENCDNLIKKRRFRPTDEGLGIRYPHRDEIDGRVFFKKNKPKVVFPSILVDVSGSMSLGDLEGVINKFPGALIAYYSGGGGEGDLVIMARDGLYSKQHRDELGMGGANLVDGPALDWLAKQPGPRFWVSDGGVHGLDGNISDTVLFDQCMLKLRVHDMEWIHTNNMDIAAEEIMQMIKKRKRK